MNVLELIGTGGYGRVFRVRAPSGAEYAAKVIDESHLDGRAVRRELRALTLLQERSPSHPALVQIRQVGQEEGRLFYTMELADRHSPLDQKYVPKSLSAELRDGLPMSRGEALGVARGLLSGLQALHDAGIVHRDLKPANVLWLNGRWAIGDFGLAVPTWERTSEAGTVGFSPSSTGTGPSDDCFALGKVLYCMLTGNRATQYPELSTRLLRSGTRAEVRQVIRFLNQACHPDPHKRFADARSMAAALDDVRSPCRRRMTPPRRAAVVALGATLTGLAMLGSASVLPSSRVVERRTVWTDPTSGVEHEYGLLVSPGTRVIGVDRPPVPAELASAGWNPATIDSDAELHWLFHAFGSRPELWSGDDPTCPDGPRGLGPALGATRTTASSACSLELARFVNPYFDSPFPALESIDRTSKNAGFRVLIVERPRLVR